MSPAKPRELSKEERYRLRKPWIKYICWAKRRCTDKTSKWFQYYGAKGITCSLTVDEGEFLWKRDRAEDLIRPSLDRKDSALGYSLENCQFIEFDDNSRIAWDPSHRDKIKKNAGVKTLAEMETEE